MVFVAIFSIEHGPSSSRIILKFRITFLCLEFLLLMQKFKVVDLLIVILMSFELKLCAMKISICERFEEKPAPLRE